ncbi:MAG: hypothetical protein HYT80_05345 [Euryarchaeota archaeon]|nr:hypothetical protein [Euryarchaeota archaeon]
MATVPMFALRGARLMAGRPGAWSKTAVHGEAAVEAVVAVSRAERVPYVYDVGGVEAGAPQHEFYQRLERRGVHPWVEAGVRSPEDAMDAFFAGADALTLDLRLLRRATLLELAGLAEGELHLAVGFRGREAFPTLKPWELQRVVADTNATGVVVEPDAAHDAHALDAFARELESQRVAASLLSWDASAPPPSAFARWIRRETHP